MSEFESNGRVMVMRMKGDLEEKAFAAVRPRALRAHVQMRTDVSVADATESRILVSREVSLAHVHAVFAQVVGRLPPTVVVVRPDQYEDQASWSSIYAAYGHEHKIFVGREHLAEACAYVEARSNPADVRAIEARAEHAAAQALSAAAARRGVFLWRTGGMLTTRATLVAVAEMTDGFFDAPRDAVLLDLRRSTLNLSAAQFADCLDTIERGFGAIAVPLAVLLKPDDAPLMDLAAERAVAAGRFFGVFTSSVADKRALEWALDVARFAKARPVAAQWRPYIDRFLGRNAAG
jgi:hypothetical protein